MLTIVRIGENYYIVVDCGDFVQFPYYQWDGRKYQRNGFMRGPWTAQAVMDASLKCYGSKGAAMKAAKKMLNENDPYMYHGCNVTGDLDLCRGWFDRNGDWHSPEIKYVEL